MQNDKDKERAAAAGDSQPADSNKRNLDDLFKEDSKAETNETPEEEAEAEQQRKEALTERD